MVTLRQALQVLEPIIGLDAVHVMNVMLLGDLSIGGLPHLTMQEKSLQHTINATMPPEITLPLVQAIPLAVEGLRLVIDDDWIKQQQSP